MELYVRCAAAFVFNKHLYSTFYISTCLLQYSILSSFHLLFITQLTQNSHANHCTTISDFFFLCFNPFNWASRKREKKHGWAINICVHWKPFVKNHRKCSHSSIDRTKYQTNTKYLQFKLNIGHNGYLPIQFGYKFMKTWVGSNFLSISLSFGHTV